MVCQGDPGKRRPGKRWCVGTPVSTRYGIAGNADRRLKAYPEAITDAWGCVGYVFLIGIK